MANREKGEVSVVIAGTSYTLVKRFKACVEAEAMLRSLGRPTTWGEIEKGLDSNSAESISVIIWALLHTYHPDMTLDDVYAMLDEVGADVVGQAIGSAFMAAIPDQRDVKALAQSRPRKAQPIRGTGENTNSQPAA